MQGPIYKFAPVPKAAVQLQRSPPGSAQMGDQSADSELSALEKKYRVVEGTPKAFSEESQAVIRNQR